MTEKGKEFGKRGPAPPVVTHRAKASAGGGPSSQKRSLAVSLAIMGALSLGVYETIDWLDRKLNCEPDPANPDELICKHRSGSTYHRSSSGWHWAAGGSSSHGASFGGFGHSGGFHFGGS
ncbi:hypothetical protein [Methylocystis sp. ATCC 49242]|uniref:hypothetical protein n=1 Tax=Methylocystis sp. ATCC 49242 TaxID=622637 RepID=UPI0001F88908|nr:hypothetical protein [Methylocystis sp. ATCC 49242]